MGQSSSKSPIVRLAKVESQLIMHYLDTASILRFARCNRQFFHAAEYSFAWKYAATLQLQWKQLKNAPKDVSRLMQHTQLALHLHWDAESDLSRKHLASLLTFSFPLYEFSSSSTTDTFQSKGLSMDQLHLIFLRPSMQQLRIVGICEKSPNSIDESIVRAITSLPHLHTFTSKRSCANANVYKSLPSAKSLTSLDVSDCHTDMLDDSVLQYVIQCQSLRHIGIKSYALCNNGLKKFIQSFPFAHQLQSLRLGNFNASDTNLDSLIAAFSTLIHLHSLYLFHGYSNQALLPILVHLPSLEYLTFHPVGNSIHSNQFWPSMFSSMMESCSKVQVTLVLEWSYHRKEVIPTQQTFVNAAEIVPFGKRFCVQLVKME